MQTHFFRKPHIIAWLICGLGALYYCYEYFLRISPSVMTAELMRTYHLTGAEVGSLSAFYYHAYMPMQILVGLLMDRYGPRLLLTLACFLCAIGTYLFANSASLAMAQVGRFLVGFGSAFAFVGALKLATIWLPPNRFALVSGVITCLGMLGAMMGDVLLRVLVDGIGWQLTNYISAVAGIVLAVVLWCIVRDINPTSQIHIVHKMRFRELLQGLLGAIKNPQIWLNGFVGFLLYVSLSAFAELWGIAYLEQAHGLSKTDAAHANAMIFFGWAIGGPFWGWLSDRLQLRRLPLRIATVCAIIFVCIFLYFPALSPKMIYSMLFFFGFFSSAQILVFAVCHEVSSQKITGTAIALTNMIVMIGGNIFQPVIGKMLDIHWAGVMMDGARVYSTSAYQFALVILPISLVVAFILLFFIRETHAKIHQG